MIIMVDAAAAELGANRGSEGFWHIEGIGDWLDGNDLLWLLWWRKNCTSQWCPVCEETKPCGCTVEWGAF
jgi:hypothetical protein